MKIIRLKQIVLALRGQGPKARDNKTGINFMILMKIVCNSMLYMFFTVCLKTGSNPTDINRFRNHTGTLAMSEVIYNGGISWPKHTRGLTWFSDTQCRICDRRHEYRGALRKERHTDRQTHKKIYILLRF